MEVLVPRDIVVEMLWDGELLEAEEWEAQAETLQSHMAPGEDTVLPIASVAHQSVMRVVVVVVP